MHSISNYIKKEIEVGSGVVTYMDIVLAFDGTSIEKAQTELTNYSNKNNFDCWRVGVCETENSYRITNDGNCYMVCKGDYKEGLKQSMQNYFKSGKSGCIEAPHVITTTHVFKSDIEIKKEPEIKIEKKEEIPVITTSDIPETKKPKQPEADKKEVIVSSKGQKKITSFFKIGKKEDQPKTIKVAPKKQQDIKEFIESMGKKKKKVLTHVKSEDESGSKSDE